MRNRVHLDLAINWPWDLYQPAAFTAGGAWHGMARNACVGVGLLEIIPRVLSSISLHCVSHIQSEYTTAQYSTGFVCLE